MAPTAIGTNADEISILASKGLNKDAGDTAAKDKEDKADASSVKGDQTLDDSVLDANLTNADFVHPTIRRTEVVLKEKADKEAAEN